MADRLFEKHFTIDEANALLPEVKKRIAKMHRLMKKLDRRRGEIVEIIQKARSNGHHLPDNKQPDYLEQLNSVIDEVSSMGAQVKDLEMGLVDFPSIRNGKEVLLCWKPGEDAVRFWHPVDKGYSARKPV